MSKKHALPNGEWIAADGQGFWYAPSVVGLPDDEILWLGLRAFSYSPYWKGGTPPLVRARRYQPESGWNPPVDLSGPGASLSERPFTQDSAGNVIVSWEAEGQLWTRRYVASSGEWTSVVQMQKAGAFASAPLLVTNDIDETFLVVAQDTGNGPIPRAYFYDPTKKEWSCPEPLDDSCGFVDGMTLELAGNEAIVAWRTIDGSKLCVARHEESSSTWSKSTTFEADSVEDFELATNPTGDAALLWKQGMNVLRVSRYKDTTQSWSPVLVLDDGPSEILFEHIDMAPSGAAIAAWYRLDDLGVGESVASHCAADTMTCGSNVLLGTVSPEASIDFPANQPTVSVDSQSVATVIWRQDLELRTNRYDPEQGGWGVGQSLGDKLSGRDARVLTMVADAEDRVTALASNGWEYFGLHFDPRDAAWERDPVEFMASGDRGLNVGTPHVDAAGNVHIPTTASVSVCWNYPWITSYVRESPVGWNTDLSFLDRSGPSDPKTAVDIWGGTLLVWKASGSGRVWFATHDPTCGGWEPARPIPNQFGSRYSGTLDLDVGSRGNGAATWRAGADVVGTYYSSTLQQWSLPTSLNMDSAGDMAADVSANRTGAITAWQQGNNAKHDIWAAVYDRDHDRWQSRMIGETDGVARAPQTAIASDGNAVVAWVQSGRLHAVEYDAATESWGTPHSLEPSSTVVSTRPRLEMDALGQAVVVWLRGSVVYGTRSTPNANSWGSPQRISTGSGVGVLELAANEQGIVTAVWSQGGRLVTAPYQPSESDPWPEPEVHEHVQCCEELKVAMDGAGDLVVVGRVHDDDDAVYQYDASDDQWTHRTMEGRVAHIDDVDVAMGPSGSTRIVQSHFGVGGGECTSDSIRAYRLPPMTQ